MTVPAVSAPGPKPASVLILGSGPVVIGQAAEFDYAGTQACRALRAEGVRTILVNSNPATIMTDPDVADAIYLEPLTVEAVEAVIAKEKPEGLLAGLGGQTALNLATALARAGVFERHDIKLLGTPLEAIHMAEDREAFRDLLDRLGQPYAPVVHRRGRRGHRDRPPDHRPAGHRPPRVHPGRHRRRHRRDRGGLPRAGPLRPAGEPHPAGHGREVPGRLAGDRVRGHARRRRHVHRRVLDGERRPAGRAHRRLDRRGARPDPARPRPPAPAQRLAGDHPGARRGGRLQRPVRAVARTTRSTRSSRSTRASRARRPWPARPPATRSPGSRPRSRSGGGWPRSPTS